MNFDSTLFFSALGLAFVMEGVLWSLFPRPMRRAMTWVTVTPSHSLRRAGLAGMAIGLVIIWLARG